MAKPASKDKKITRIDRRDKTGKIEVITGGMFSGKTGELIRRVVRAKLGQQKVLSFKADLDNRYDDKKIVSHSGSSIESIAVPATAAGVMQIEETIKEYEKKTGHIDVVAIDEVHFFDDSVVDLADKLADRGIRVILAGLDLNFADEPFPPMGRLLAKAEQVDKLHAVCMVCGAEGTKTQLKKKFIDSLNEPIIGGAEKYESRCRSCYQRYIKTEKKIPLATKNSEKAKSK